HPAVIRRPHQRSHNPCIFSSGQKNSGRMIPALPTAQSLLSTHYIRYSFLHSGHCPSHRASPSVSLRYPLTTPPRKPAPDIGSASPLNRCTEGARLRSVPLYGCLSILYPTPHT